MKPYIIENEELMKEWDWKKNNAEGLNPEKITECCKNNILSSQVSLVYPIFTSILYSPLSSSNI